MRVDVSNLSEGRPIELFPRDCHSRCPQPNCQIVGHAKQNKVGGPSSCEDSPLCWRWNPLLRKGNCSSHSLVQIACSFCGINNKSIQLDDETLALLAVAFDPSSPKVEKEKKNSQKQNWMGVSHQFISSTEWRRSPPGGRFEETTTMGSFSFAWRRHGLHTCIAVYK